MTRLEHLTVARGYADNEGDRIGAGGYFAGGHPKFIDCTFRDHFALNSGAALYFDDCEPVLTDCSFHSNTSFFHGGAVASQASIVILDGCIVQLNKADVQGGAISVYNGQVHLSGCVVRDNTSGSDGGAIYLYDGQCSISNSYLFRNESGHSGAVCGYESAITVANSEFVDHEAGSGECICNEGFSPVVAISTIFRNNDAEAGGALHSDNFLVSNCLFEDNQADHGGSVRGSGWLTGSVFENCDFIDSDGLAGGAVLFNTSDSVQFVNCSWYACAGVIGGAVFSHGTGTAEFTNCRFEECVSDSGGALDLGLDKLVLVQCELRQNLANDMGSVVNLVSVSECEIVNSVFDTNFAPEGGAIYADDDVDEIHVINCTMIGNTAWPGSAAIDAPHSAVTIANTIMRGSAPVPIIGANVSVSFSNIEGGYAGEGNIDADPLFVDPFNGDLQLSAGSPCIDAGSNELVPSDVETDFDGNERFVDDIATVDTGVGPGSIVDMGAFEFAGTNPNLTGDGIVGPQDLAQVLGPCPVGLTGCFGDLNGDGVVGPADLALVLGSWKAKSQR